MRLVVLGLAAIFAVTSWQPRQARAEDARDILVIANKSLGAKTITIEEIKDFFLKKRTQLDNGKNVVAINARPGSLLRQQFDSTALGMTESQEMTYWQNRKIKSGDTPPPEFSDSLKAVFKLKNGIGYIFRGEMKGSVVDVIAEIPFTSASPPLAP